MPVMTENLWDLTNISDLKVSFPFWKTEEILISPIFWEID